ncbi:MAG TPA: hypothetical protein DCP69_10115 [Candidatus Omnitrophica bacterium]|nr:hypothetical protein [Candidatus Omnitrophota bacterium]
MTQPEAISLPFRVGDVLWMPLAESRQVTIPCPICAGKRVVRVELGDGDLVTVDCDGCGLGFSGPQGTITEREHDPKVERFEIAEPVSLYGGEWQVRSTTGAEHELKDLYPTEAEAFAVAAKRSAQQTEHNMMSRARRKKGLSKTAWTVRYHRERIRDAERELAWHRARLHDKWGSHDDAA